MADNNDRARTVQTYNIFQDQADMVTDVAEAHGMNKSAAMRHVLDDYRRLLDKEATNLMASVVAAAG